MPEMKNIDFLMVTQGVMHESDIREFINELKNVTFILAVFSIPLEDYKSKSNFFNFL